ncbi:MAG TPA: hypothetical protein VLT62_10630 [Candidatus Methylomirabilis sp.]|nr:hypothetical protein [Candidatus Methylomirabilis sp.]
MRTLRASLVVVLSLAGILLALPAPAALAADAGGPEDALHQVRPGDELHLLAGYYYGDARQWERIWQVNRDQVSNPNRIRRGMILRIPDATPPAEPYADFVARTRRAQPIAAPPPKGEAATDPAAALPPPGQQPPAAGAPEPAGAAGAPSPPPAKRP